MKKALLILVFSAAFLPGWTQYQWDYGMNVGVANYLGEIGGKEKTRRDFILDMKLSQTQAAVLGFARYKMHPDVLVRFSTGWMMISGNDNLSTNPGRRGRNLSFRNNIFEASMTGQYIFYDIADLGRTYRYRNDFKAYIFAGAGMAYHNPQAYYNDSWVNLQPLRTEGQGLVTGQPKPYSKFIGVVPAGAGFFFTISKTYRIGWEFNWRTTFTDYLDDVSTVYVDPAALQSDEARDLANRNDEIDYSADPDVPHPNNYLAGSKRGDPTHKDSYLTTTVNASMVIKGKSTFSKNRYKSAFKGKKFNKRTIRAKF